MGPNRAPRWGQVGLTHSLPGAHGQMSIGGTPFATFHRSLTSTRGSLLRTAPIGTENSRLCGPRSRLWQATRPLRLAGTPQSGRAGPVVSRLPKPHEWPFRIGRCCCSLVLSTHSETRQVWLGTAQRTASTKSRTLCGPRTRRRAWLARSTKRSSSRWDAASTRRHRWHEPYLGQFDWCSTASRLRYAVISTGMRLPA